MLNARFQLLTKAVGQFLWDPHMSAGKNQGFIYWACIMICTGLLIVALAKPITSLITRISIPFKKMLHIDEPRVVYVRLIFNGLALTTLPIAAFVLRYFLQSH